MGCNPSKDGGAVGREGVGGDGGGGVTNKLSSAAKSDAAETLLIPLGDGKWTLRK